MAQASADTDGTDLEQRILQVLKKADSPVKAAQLAKECQEPKKNINRVLYRMKDKLLVDDAGSATWCLREGGTGEMVPTAPAQPSHEPVQEQILRLLAASGPLRALSIAQSLGMKTSRDVNPYLYAMQKEHLLYLDKKSNTWEIYQPGNPRGRSQSTPVIYQQNSITICQNGPHGQISIRNSEAVQIGHGNSIMKHLAPAESGSMAPLCLPPPPAAGPRAQDPPAGPWGPQDIHIDNSVLRRVQLGHGNEMNLHGTLATGPGHSPPVSAATAGPEAVFEIRMPTPGPHPEGEGDAAQRVLIKSCFLEDAAIGNNNSLSVRPRAAGLGAGAGPEAGRGDPGEPAEDAAPRPGAAEPRGKFPEGAGPADPDMSTFTSHLEAMTLENRDSEAPEDSP
ncbi:Z-DNA-binding protein 1 [Eptesicus fuscus]|uniref:Z-DNA-binding protein 1 n=1 Tax=Eptesicus fuscus TaxID=29078 RepID=UPI0024046C57|nr:Z-DNA-binding protein 1 [Eptesicus fuscus]